MSRERSNVKAQDRYALLLRPNQRSGSSDDEMDSSREDEESLAYAKFLKERERKCGPDGYVDSTRFRHSYVSKKDKKQQSRDDSDDSSKPMDGSANFSSILLHARREKDRQEHERRLKLIEDHMWQHKQEERELKRVEGDILKNQRIVRRSLRDYEQAITRKRMAEEKKLNQSMDKYTQLQRENVHKKEELTRQRTEQNVAQEHSQRDTGRKVQITTSELARQYRNKMNEMEIKRIQMERLSQDYESKIQKREEEQYRLKQELGELAVSLNMEAMKGRTAMDSHHQVRKKEERVRLRDDKSTEVGLESKIKRGDIDVKESESNKRKLSADLTLTRAHLQLKQREEGRHKQDTGNRLRGIQAEQKQLNEAAIHAEMELKSKQIDQKVQEHNARKRELAQRTQSRKKELGESSENLYTGRAQQRYNEQLRHQHEDHLKHFQKAVAKEEEVEYSLYNQVKNAEYARQKHEQAVRRLQNKLNETRRENAVKIKDEMKELTKQEEELEQKLVRARAQLTKVHSQREESYMSLQKHRQQLRGDKYLLAEHEREHDRLVRIGQRSEVQAGYA